MYYLLEDNRIIDSTNEKDISRLKWNYNCEVHNGKIYFYKPRNNYNCKEACGEKGSFCVGCKDAFKAKFNKIKKQSENVFDLIEVGDLIASYRYSIEGRTEEKEINSVDELFAEENGVGINQCCIVDFEDICAIYKSDSKGNYIKVWEKKDENT